MLNNINAAALVELFSRQIIALAVMGQGGAGLDVLGQMIDVAMTALPAAQ
jgi:hypothetical protein